MEEVAFSDISSPLYRVQKKGSQREIAFGGGQP